MKILSLFTEGKYSIERKLLVITFVWVEAWQHIKVVHFVYIQIFIFHNGVLFACLLYTVFFYPISFRVYITVSNVILILHFHVSLYFILMHGVIARPRSETSWSSSLAFEQRRAKRTESTLSLRREFACFLLFVSLSNESNERVYSVWSMELKSWRWNGDDLRCFWRK